MLVILMLIGLVTLVPTQTSLQERHQRRRNANEWHYFAVDPICYSFPVFDPMLISSDFSMTCFIYGFKFGLDFDCWCFGDEKLEFNALHCCSGVIFWFWIVYGNVFDLFHVGDSTTWNKWLVSPPIDESPTWNRSCSVNRGINVISWLWGEMKFSCG